MKRWKVRLFESDWKINLLSANDVIQQKKIIWAAWVDERERERKADILMAESEWKTYLYSLEFGKFKRI